MNYSLHNKTILLTGASRGFGRVIAQQCLYSGANLVLVARNQALLQQVAAELYKDANSDQVIHSVAADITKLDELPQLFEQICKLTPVDVLINNAAIQGPIGRFHTQAWDEWQQVMVANFLAPVRLCQLCIPYFLERNTGKIINISGGGATSARPDFSAYASAKTALVRFSETIAAEFLDTSISINSVAPGAMNTKMLEELLQAGPQAAPQEYQQALKRHQEGGASMEQAARLVVFLASSASDGITGKLLSAVWDPWETLAQRPDLYLDRDLFTLRRILPEERGKSW